MPPGCLYVMTHFFGQCLFLWRGSKGLTVYHDGIPFQSAPTNVPIEGLQQLVISNCDFAKLLPTYSSLDSRRCCAPDDASLNVDRFVSAGDRVLEIGSRARSGYSSRNEFAHKNYTGLDILPGPNVDVVGDAHMLGDYFPSKEFDFVYSSSVLEHMVQPWVFVRELNKVMKKGAVFLGATHQVLGLHDTPWDFYRFSEHAWQGLFNNATGFEILRVKKYDDCHSAFIVPAYVPHSWIAEATTMRSRGSLESKVAVRKTHDWDGHWKYTPASEMYPKGEYNGRK